METLLSKLSELKNFFVGKKADLQDVRLLDGWISQAKKLLLIKSLAEHDGIKYVIDIFQAEVDAINRTLIGSDSKVLPDYERDRLIDRRDLAKKYLDLFLPVDNLLEKLENDVDTELNNL